MAYFFGLSMADLGNLVVSLEANMARFNANMNEASRQTEQSMRRMQAATDLAKGAVAALISVAAVGALAVLVKGAIDAADNLRDMSQKTGIAVEELNGLAFAAGQAGGSLESMVAAAGKLNKSIADAGTGGKDTGAAFKAMGIDVRDSNGQLKTADVVMAELADKFAQYKDGPEKSAIALALFSKAGADMIPILNDGGDSMRDNIEYAKKYSGQTAELANMSDEFNDQMGKLSLQQKTFGNVLAADVLPVLNLVAGEMLGAAEDADTFSLASTAIRTILETVVVIGSEVAYTFTTIGKEIGGTASQLAALASLDIDGFRAIGRAMEEDQAEALKKHEEFLKKVLDRTKAASGAAAAVGGDKPAAPELPGAPKPKAPGKAEKTEEQKALEAGDAMIAKLNEQAGAYGLTGAALLSYQLVGSKMPESYKQQALALQTTIDGLKEEEEANKARAARMEKEAETQRRMAEQNAANVEQIRAGLLSDVEREKEAHQFRLDELQLFHDARLENVVQANALIEAENARHEKVKTDMTMQHNQQVIGMAGDSAAQLYSIMQQAGLEQTALGKALFIANKAIAIAEIIMNTEVAAAKALTMGPVLGPPLAMAIRVMGYASAGIVLGTTIASAEGGYDIPAGTNPVTQLHEKEMVLPKAQADVIRGLANGTGSSGGMGANVTYSPQIHIDSRTDQEEVHRMVIGAVQQGNADLVDKLQRAGRI